MSKKGTCELCRKPARMFCDSDQASLCWDCDEKVHAANFLVAKHTRTLLCHVCHSPTPWRAAGLKLGSAVSVCHACCSSTHHNHQGVAAASTSRREINEDGYDSHQEISESDDGDYYTSDSDDFSEEEEEEEKEEEEDGENQVVPWSSTPASTLPPPGTAASSSSSEENVSLSSSKRTRDQPPFESEEEEDGCCSSQNLDEYSSRLSFQESINDHDNNNYSLLMKSLSSRPLKMRRRRRRSCNDSALDIPSEAAGEQARGVSGTAAIVEKLGGFEQQIVTQDPGDPSAVVILAGPLRPHQIIN